ncbi:MAG: BlaI/MecI/CopY family transcriptional regulator [Sphingomonas sp.]|jgi:predicted transcriptional regulator|uniref:BlaI/MecI/CopY family transcriptional regulator n=1 Tax=Sphingomonas sp. TaxID=28214 RepID=UPI003563D63E
MLPQLPPRERQIVDLLYQGGSRTVSEICAALPDPLTGSAVRAMLKRLEDKGFVSRQESDRGFVYSPTVSDNQARRTALGQVVRTFFKGSPVSAASALLGMAQDIDTRELDELEAAIARARLARDSGK